jgi:hypothetical protein
MPTEKELFFEATRSLHAAMGDYLLLLGEPCPLLGSLCSHLIDIIGQLPPGDEFQTENIYKLASITLEAAVLGIMDRLQALTPESIICLHGINDCMEVVKTLGPRDRCSVFFKVLGIAISGLREITKQEYPQLYDGKGKKL